MPEMFPEMILALPDIDLNVPGIKGKLLQAQGKQVVFFEAEPIGVIPPHAHGAQWGVLIEGEVELTVGDETRIMRKGDSYYIPAGVMHSVRIKAPMKALDVFDDADRYKAKK